MKAKLFMLWIVCFLTTTLSANETHDIWVPVDQEISSEKELDHVLPDTTKTETVDPEPAKQRNLRYNILGGPSYTPDLGLLIGGSALATFRINPEDKDQIRSVVPIGMAVMFKGGFNVTSRPQLFFKDDRFRIFGEFLYKIWKITIMVWDTVPTEIIYGVTLPVSIVTMGYKSIPGSYSGWERVVSS